MRWGIERHLADERGVDGRTDVVTAAIAPGPLAGLASPATNAPPTQPGQLGTGQPVTGHTFADAVAAISDAAPVTGGEPNAPPGAPATSTNPASPADLLLLIAGVMARLKGGVAGTGDGKTNDTPLPDRPAGAGVEQTNTGAMEALMGQLLLMRANPEPLPGSGTAASGVEAVTSASGSGAGDAAKLLEEIAQMLQAGPAPAPAAPAGASRVTEAATAAIETKTSTAEASATVATVAPTVAQLVASEPAPAAVPAAAVTVSAAATAQPTRSEDARDVSTTANAVAPIPVAATQASTARPAESVSEIRERVARGRETEPTTAATVPNTVPAAAPQAENVPAVASTSRGEASGPVTVQIANTVQSAVLHGEHEVRMVLNPPELGRVEIKITQGDTGVSVQMHAEQAGAHDLIQQQLPLLHQALESRDVRVDRLQVSHAGQSDASQSFLDSRGFANQQQQQRDDAPEWSPLASFGVTPAAPARDAVRSRIASDGGLDVMA